MLKEHGSVTLTQLWKYFEVGSLVQGATKHKCRTSMRKMVALFGDVAAGTVDLSMIGQWQCWMRDDRHMSSASVRSYFASVAQVFAWGLEVGLVAANPWAFAKRLRSPKREVVVFTADELADLVDAAARIKFQDRSSRLRWTAILLLASGSGLRIGEILNLRWDDLDLDAALVHVRYRPDVFGEYWLWGTKTEQDRIVPISQEALEVLYRVAEVATWRYPFIKRITCTRLQQQVGSIAEDVRKFPYRDFYREFAKIKKAANVTRQTRGSQAIKDGCLHQMRKTAVTAWARSGVPMIDAQVVAGHRSMATTRNYYIAIDAAASVSRIRTAIDAGPGRQ